MRKLIAAFKTSIDSMIEGPEGFADWVDTWSEDYGFSPRIDACILGAGMYPGYESYWSAIQNSPEIPLPMTGRLPTQKELEWAQFAARTPHYVLSGAQTSAAWPLTRFLREIADVAALKQQDGKDIYVVGGGQIVSSLMDAGLIDELRLIVYPLIAGPGKPAFGTIGSRHAFNLTRAEPMSDGRISLIYLPR